MGLLLPSPATVNLPAVLGASALCEFATSGLEKFTPSKDRTGTNPQRFQHLGWGLDVSAQLVKEIQGWDLSVPWIYGLMQCPQIFHVR